MLVWVSWTRLLFKPMLALLEGVWLVLILILNQQKLAELLHWTGCVQSCNMYAELLTGI